MPQTDYTSAITTEPIKTANKRKPKTINKQKAMALLKEAFPTVDENVTWTTYKDTGYILDKTIRYLCAVSGDQPEKIAISIQNKINQSRATSSQTEDSTPSKAPRMKTSEEVYNRIKWNPDYDPDDFVIGYEDRFVGIQEAKLSTFDRDVTSETFIPWHRVMYFKRQDEVVWDRRIRMDKVFGSTQAK
jgi:uncharacterized protein (UPF0248 family)